jgi:hypothetical protein
VDGKTTTVTLVSGDAVTYVDAGLKLLPTAARLAYFRAVAAGATAVQVTWGTLVESGALGFRVERTSTDGVWQRITPMIPATGWDQRPQTYRHTDAAAPASDGLTYRLIEVGLGGGETVIAVARVEAGVTIAIARRDTSVTLSARGVPQAKVTLSAAETVDGPWTAIETLTLDDAGNASVHLDQAAATAARFFRAVTE